MNAIVCDKRDSLKLEEIERPAVPDDGVLVRVHASSVNPVDLFPLSNAGRLMRRINRKPRRDVLGTDFAGIVESVGKDVRRFRPGDEVFGGEHGSFAEYVSISETGALARKPANITFEQAGTVAVAALTALQAVRDHGQVKPGDNVLINGASGGVGTFAVQIARSFGADVTAVCSPRNVDAARSLGAQRVIDYTREDFTKSGEFYDALIDIAGSRSLPECRPVLKPDATFVLVGAAAVQHTSEMKAFGHIIGTRLGSVRGSQKVVFFIARMTQKDMEVIAGLVAAGKATPVIDRRYRLDQLADAFAYFNEGHARGKIALEVTHSSPDGARANPQPQGVAVRPGL
ncbi:MAG: NAD(P)-dependent alcohol dehydrogenase [Chloroflexi bacterium]|nr:MAG: NAD(P)-dependent alcohol dehydrogenase [Chloroflexota bacterium]